MSRWVKVLLGVLLLPLCLGASQATFWVLIQSGAESEKAPVLVEGQGRSSLSAVEETAGGERADLKVTGRVERGDYRSASLTLVPLLGGAACWVVIYVMLPKPMWVYVFGHELTHVIWAWIFEARVKKFHVSSRGGHVILDRVNFLIVLAPYFFPLYALGVALVYGVGNVIWDWTSYRVAFLMLLGAAYAFHVTLTLHALKTEQTDITSQGWFFSIVVIWLGNLVFFVPGLCVLLGVSIEGAFREWLSGTWSVVRLLGGVA